MEYDLVCYTISGGMWAFMETGESQEYIQFGSESLGICTRERRIRQGVYKGYISKNKQRLFYYHYNADTGDCMVYPVINNRKSKEGFVPAMGVVNRD